MRIIKHSLHYYYFILHTETFSFCFCYSVYSFAHTLLSWYNGCLIQFAIAIERCKFIDFCKFFFLNSTNSWKLKNLLNRASTEYHKIERLLYEFIGILYLTNSLNVLFSVESAVFYAWIVWNLSISSLKLQIIRNNRLKSSTQSFWN